MPQMAVFPQLPVYIGPGALPRPYPSRPTLTPVDSSELLYPWEFYDARGVRQILTEDSMCRRRVKWPLVPLEAFKYYRSEGTASKYALDSYKKSKGIVDHPNQIYMGSYDATAYNIYNHLTPIQRKNALYFTGGLDASRNYPDFVISNDAILTQLETSATDHIQNLYKYYPHLPLLFSKYKGKIAVCGGLITKLLTSTMHDLSDCDIFFYNCTETEATNILFHCMAIICSSNDINNSLGNNNEMQVNGNVIRVEHKLNVTSIIIGPNPNLRRSEYREILKYQFIHRVYSSLDSIIGGFDLGPCMLAFDGDMIYGTPLGAWSIAKGALIVDTTRRSVSFEHRIRKYAGNYRLNVVFPGMTIENTSNEFFQTRFTPFSEKIAQVTKLMAKLGIGFNSECFRRNYSESRSASRDYFEEEHNLYVRLPKVKIHTDNGTWRLNRLYINGEKKNEGELIRQDDHPVAPPEYVKRYSDYEGVSSFMNDLDVSKANLMHLRIGNMDAIASYVTFNSEDYSNNEQKDDSDEDNYGMTYEEAIKDLKNMFNYPNLFYEGEGISPNGVNTYVDDVIRHLVYPPRDYMRTKKDLRWFAEFVPEFRRLYERRSYDQELFVSRMNEIINILNTRMINNCKIMERELVGVKWITQDPGRQYTSSINPIIKDPRDFYGDWYVPFHIGIPRNVEITLYLIRKHQTINKNDNGRELNSRELGNLPRDLFSLLMNYVMRAYVYNVDRENDYNKNNEQNNQLADVLSGNAAPLAFVQPTQIAPIPQIPQLPISGQVIGYPVGMAQEPYNHEAQLKSKIDKVIIDANSTPLVNQLADIVRPNPELYNSVMKRMELQQTELQQMRTSNVPPLPIQQVFPMQAPTLMPQLPVIPSYQTLPVQAPTLMPTLPTLSQFLNRDQTTSTHALTPEEILVTQHYPHFNHRINLQPPTNNSLRDIMLGYATPQMPVQLPIFPQTVAVPGQYRPEYPPQELPTNNIIARIKQVKEQGEKAQNNTPVDVSPIGRPIVHYSEDEDEETDEDE